ncbi:MAG: DUF3810 domain-containing protein [Lachnospiraceae bacterium]
MKRFNKIFIAVVCLAVILNLLALSNSFCDFYIDHIFPVWVNTYGRFSGIFSFSLGEKLIIAGIVLVLWALVSGILLIFLRKKSGYKKYAVIFFKTFACILLGVVLIMTLNCSLLYGASKLTLTDQSKEEYTIEELENLRNMIVEECNRLAPLMERDENGYVVYDGDMYEETVKAMKSISEDFPRFRGYYPKAKPISASGFMSQSYTSGVYFPFSMEANYNNMMYIVNYPAVICHEYCHLKGYIFEDEANFFGYLACINSDDPFVRYSGYSSVLGYVDDSYFDSVGIDRYVNQVEIHELVLKDFIFLTPETWEVVEEDSIIDTETVDEVTDTFTDNSLKFFGVEEGIISYDRVTELLLEYYRDKGGY